MTTHVHTDGPIPGPHSLLTLASSAYRADGVPIGTFTANLRELPGATLHPSSLETWRDRAEDWLWTRRAARPPAQVAHAYAAWVESLGGRPVFVTAPEDPDHLFCYWYLQRFAGRWPFAGLVPASAQRVPDGRRPPYRPGGLSHPRTHPRPRRFATGAGGGVAVSGPVHDGGRCAGRGAGRRSGTRPRRGAGQNRCLRQRFHRWALSPGRSAASADDRPR
ncbi:Glycerol-3-phosphate ABC transporter, permease protein UgpE [Pseudonocardia sp. Ae263_Ps1]|nr:Glycerol-3-phosphate ABC transporter, permease protein UgpE [Pseudonocardia sp. Ae263_Ps1]OLL94081.1 Glycerol-3-phosphate ABC transporter, permease protein UgpE [Pseudonocardia sp. Ae356_Ps1]